MKDDLRIKPDDWLALHGIAFFSLLTAATFVPALRVWPLLWLAPLGAYAGLVAIVPGLRASFRPWHLGAVTRRNALATAVIALGSCLVLAGFHRLTQPDVRAYAAFLPVSSLGGVLAVGILFSILNALLEEIIFRGIFFDAIQSQWGVRGAVLGTAFLFGFGHLHGYPPGYLGAALAGIYGLILGWLRVVSKGLGLPVLAHIAADAAIFSILARAGVL